MGDVKKQQTGSMARIKDMTVKVWGIEERAVIISCDRSQSIEKSPRFENQFYFEFVNAVFLVR